jgi:ATP-dependent Clp protease ATP-binding subunit ClpA
MTAREDGGQRASDERPVPEPSGIRRLFSRMRHSGAPSSNGEPSQQSSPAAALPNVKPDLLERLSPAALKTLSFAQEEAKTLGHRHIGTEHLLLALTRDPEFTAYKILEQMDAVPATVRTQVIHVLVTGPEVGPGAMTLTPRARLALELAHRASTRIGVPQTGTEHLLIGLAAESEGIGARTLSKSGISAKAAEHQVTTNLDGKNALGPEARRNFAKTLCESRISTTAAQNHVTANSEALLVEG